MWLTILLAGVATLLVLMTAGALFHLRWVDRLPASDKRVSDWDAALWAAAC